MSDESKVTSGGQGTQAETPRPLTLSAIETKLVAMELDSIAAEIKTAAKSLARALGRFYQFGGSGPIWEYIKTTGLDWPPDAVKLGELISEDGKESLARHVAESFLDKVREIEAIAYKALEGED